MESSQFGAKIDYKLIQKMKNTIRKTNARYIIRHPELRAVVGVLVHELIDKQPENIAEFSASLFDCKNSNVLVTKINKQIKRIKKRRDNIDCTEEESDGDDSFSPPTSTHSLHSTDSIPADIDRLLRYAGILRDKK